MDISSITSNTTTTTTTTTPTPTPTTLTTETTTTGINNENNYNSTGKQSLIVFNLPKNTDQKKFTKIVESTGLIVPKVKKTFRDNYGLIFFDNEETKTLIYEKIHGLQLEGNNEKLKVSERRKDKVSKRKLDGDNNSGQDNEKKVKLDENGEDNNNNTVELKLIDDVISPWYLKPYSEQIELKKQRLNEILIKIRKSILKESAYNLPEWLNGPSRVVCCPLEGVIETEQQYMNGYRNKAAYTIGLDKDNQMSIGFALGKTKNGITIVGDPSSSVIISDKSKKIRTQFEKYIRERSVKVEPNFKTYDKFSHDGFWRQLTVRDFTTGESMACVQVNHKGMTEVQINQEKQAIIDYFNSLNEDDKITSISIQLYDGLSNSAPVDLKEEVLLGTSSIKETILGLSFDVSYNAFFQVNTKTTELLYSKVLEWAQVNNNDVLLDICCGTGTIGQCMASKVKKVYGLDIAPDAILDATNNLKNNKLTNVEYLVGKAEHTLPQLLSRNLISKDEGCVGIVDPPRAGLHQDVIKAIRSFESIKKLVYVSCNQDSLVQDSIRLCKGTSKTMPGKPFRPIKSIAVDLFPHTELVELVVLFERIE